MSAFDVSNIFPKKRSTNMPGGIPFNPLAGTYMPTTIQEPVGNWGRNASGFELREGYIVAIELKAEDYGTGLFTITRPNADNMPNVAVVKSVKVSAASTSIVELILPGENSVVFDRDEALNSVYDLRLWWGGTSPTGHEGEEEATAPAVGASVGSLKDSFECKAGGGSFITLGEGAEIVVGTVTTKRLKVCFAAAGGAEITLGIVQTANTTAHTLTYKSLALLADVTQTPNITGIGTVSASIPYVVVR